MTNKVCSRCAENKDYICFYKSKVSKDGFVAACKSCRSKDFNREKRKQYDKIYYGDKDKEKIRKQKYYTANKIAILARNKEIEKRLLKEDVKFKIAKYLRNRLSNSLKRNTKNGSAVKDLGCSLEELKQYLESKFQNEMTWDNYGSWHIDHIIPLASFDLSNREELLKACHYSNLQPLWALDNLKKGKSINEAL